MRGDRAAPAGSFPLTLRFGVVDGRFALVRVEIGPDLRDPKAVDAVPVTPGTLRGLAPRLRLLIDANAVWNRDLAAQLLRRDLSEQGRLNARTLSRAAARPASRRGRRPLDRAYFEQVARIYEGAWRRGLNPTVAVRDHFRIASSTAAHHVARARNQYRLLPRTKQGQARATGAGHGIR